MENERTLLEKLARGDRASFDALYMRYAAKTEEFLCRMLKNRAEAEDITHDLFLKIWQNRSTMAGVTAFGSYLFRMARNAVYDRFDSRTVRTNFARQTNLLPEYELPDVDNRDLLLLIQLAVRRASPTTKSPGVLASPRAPSKIRFRGPCPNCANSSR